jgi:hypothetical protein
MLEKILGSEVTATVLVVVVPYLLARAFAWWVARAKARGDEEYALAVQALEIGVKEAWRKFGRRREQVDRA